MCVLEKSKKDILVFEVPIKWTLPAAHVHSKCAVIELWRLEWPQNYWMSASLVKPCCKWKSWKSKLLFTVEDRVRLLCTSICAMVEKLKGHGDWLSNARQPGFPLFLIRWIKVRNLKKIKIITITPWRGFVNQSCRSLGCLLFQIVSVHISVPL